MPYRWLITIALLGVGACHVTTGLALRAAAGPGRIMLIFGGVIGMLIAANPEPSSGGSVPHVLFSCTGVVLMTLWPVAAVRQDASAPFGLRPHVAVAAGLVTLGLLLWFTAQLFGGSQLGLAERAVTADQSLWPLIVVSSVLVAMRRPVPAGKQAAPVRSR